MSYISSYTNRIKAISSKIDALEILIRKTSSGECSAAMLQSISILRASLNDVNFKYNQAVKKYNAIPK